MKVKINFEYEDGADFIILNGSLEEIQKEAEELKNKRQAIDAWSEVIEE